MPNSSQFLQAAAALSGAAAVVLGALGAHALQSTLAERGNTGAWETAVLYHVFHALAAWVATLGVGDLQDRGRLRLAAGLWLGGVLLFSGSLYVLALGGPRLLGPVTPLGGLLLIAGWLAAAAVPLRRSR